MVGRGELPKFCFEVGHQSVHTYTQTETVTQPNNGFMCKFRFVFAIWSRFRVFFQFFFHFHFPSHILIVSHRIATFPGLCECMCVCGLLFFCRQSFAFHFLFPTVKQKSMNGAAGSLLLDNRLWMNEAWRNDARLFFCHN